MLCINTMESIRREIASLINLGSNKACVVSLIKLKKLFKYC